MNELVLPIVLIVVVTIVAFIVVKRIKKDQNRSSKVTGRPSQANTVVTVKPSGTPTPSMYGKNENKTTQATLDDPKPKRKPRAKKTEDEGKKSEPKKSLARKAPKKK